MDMNRERWAGLIFVGIGALALVLIVVVLGTSRSRHLHYTALFDNGKGLSVGDRVVMSGVAIGEVERIDLGVSGDRVSVRLKIMPDHRAKVMRDSTAYITDATLLNVAGQKVVEIHNGSGASSPMPDNARVEGKDSWIEMKSWALKEKLTEWSETVVDAGKDLADGASEMSDGIRETTKNVTQSAKKSIRNGIAGGVKDGITEPDPEPETGTRAKNDTPAPAQPPPPIAEGGEAPPPDVINPPVTEDPKTITTAEAARRMKQFLTEMGEMGRDGLGLLKEKWESIKAEVMPLIRRLRESGQEMLTTTLEKIMTEIEEQLDRLEQEGPAGPETAPEADPADPGMPIEI